ncbi:interleukin-15 receptor subunit alpha-like isoform X1 [Hypomesus transpacificus]|uniref:interleukin-15 receptor subunit alpha-like isoform X1 n=1 Tax=Hypomesus transpacificus TaxID=137520 RepID=UPI001F0760BE|nr:interleukin-15 receptor subunit alpha-like isoform X1 [Hypomesus transpacificus]
MCPALFFIVVCLFVPCTSEGREDFCPQPPKKNHTKPLRADCLANGKESCRVNDTRRYICEEGYVRKAGTSGLIKCKLVNHRLVWEEAKSSIQCICKGTTYAICPADSTQTPTMPPAECPERNQPKSTQGSILALDDSPPSQTTPTPTMHLSEPTITMKAGPQTFPTMPSSEATLASETGPLFLTTSVPTETLRTEATPAMLPSHTVAQTQALATEFKPPDCSEGCGATTALGETLTPESGTAVTPARILSTKEKITIGATGGLFIMIVAAVGIGIRLNHNRGFYFRARREEPMSMDNTRDIPTTFTTTP